MVDFSNPNICGASPELNSVLEKLNTEKLDVKNKLDEAASTAAAAFKEAKDELAGLKDKLQTIEIPTLPKLNLQAEIKSLTSQIPGTPSFFSSLANIEKEFGDDIKSAGLSLGTLVSGATEAIAGGGDPCALVPNLEKQAGSTEPSVQKPAPVKQAAKPAEPETASKAKQNLNVEVKMAKLANKASSYSTGSVPPKSDTGAIRIVKADQTIKSPVGGDVKTAPAGTGKNYSPDGGIINKKASFTQLKGLGVITNLGQDGTFPDLSPSGRFPRTTYKITLKYEPVDQIKIFVHLGDFMQKFHLQPTPGGSIARMIGNHYYSFYGPHMFAWIKTGSGVESKGHTQIKINGKELLFSSPKPLVDHPGNIVSIKNDYLDMDGVYRTYGDHTDAWSSQSERHFQDFQEDEASNSVFGGYAMVIEYEYLENYDPEPETVGATTTTTTTTTTTGGGSTTTTSAGTTTTPSTTTTTTTTKPAPKPADVKKKAATVKKATDRDFETTKEDLQKIADADGFGQTVTGGPRRHRSGRPLVTVSGSAGQFRQIGSTPEKAFRKASNLARGLKSNGTPKK